MNFLIARDFVYSDINFVTRERLDPLLNSLAQLFPQTAYIYFLLQLSVSFIGCYLLFRLLVPKLRTPTLSALIFVAASLIVLGAEPVSWRIHWFPMLFFSLCLAFERPLKGSLFLVPVLVIWVISAGSASILGILFGVSAAFVLSPYKRGCGAIVMLLAIAIVLAYFTLPMYKLPDYPEGAQLVPLSGIQALPRPLFGPYYHVRTIVEAEYRDTLKTKVLLAALCFVVLLLPRLFDWKTIGLHLRTYVWISLLALVGIWFIGSELYLFNANREYGLYATILRIVPGVALSGLPWIYFPMFFLVCLTILPKSSHKAFSPLSLGVLAFFLLLRPGSYSLSVGAQRYILGTAEGSPQMSASKYVIDYWGEWVLDPSLAQQRDFSRVRWLRDNVDYIASFNANPRTEIAWKAGDGDARTRWSTGRPQTKGDFFEAQFDRTLEVIKIILSIQGTPTDFPRGLRVEVVDESGTSQTLFEKHDWIGPVKWSASGYPYFGGQSEVIIELPQTYKIKSLKATQIGNDPVYDWSVGELKLFSRQ